MAKSWFQMMDSFTNNINHILLISIVCFGPLLLNAQDSKDIELVIPTGHEKRPIPKVYTSPAGRFMVTSSSIDAILWDKINRKMVKKTTRAKRMYGGFFNQHESHCYYANEGIYRWDMIADSVSTVLKLDGWMATNMIVNHDSNIVAVSVRPYQQDRYKKKKDRTYFYSYPDFTYLKEIVHNEHQYDPEKIFFSPKSTYYVVGHTDVDLFVVYNFATGEMVEKYSDKEAPFTLMLIDNEDDYSFSKNAKMLGIDTMVEYPVREVLAAKMKSRPIIVSKNGDSLISHYGAGAVWYLTDNRPRRVLGRSDSEFLEGSGELLRPGELIPHTDDNTVSLYNPNTWKRVFTFPTVGSDLGRGSILEKKREVVNHRSEGDRRISLQTGKPQEFLYSTGDPDFSVKSKEFIDSNRKVFVESRKRDNQFFIYNFDTLGAPLLDWKLNENIYTKKRLGKSNRNPLSSVTYQVSPSGKYMVLAARYFMRNYAKKRQIKRIYDFYDEGDVSSESADDIVFQIWDIKNNSLINEVFMLEHLMKFMASDEDFKAKVMAFVDEKPNAIAFLEENLIAISAEEFISVWQVPDMRLLDIKNGKPARQNWSHLTASQFREISYQFRNVNIIPEYGSKRFLTNYNHQILSWAIDGNRLHLVAERRGDQAGETTRSAGVTNFQFSKDGSRLFTQSENIIEEWTWPGLNMLDRKTLGNASINNFKIDESRREIITTYKRSFKRWNWISGNDIATYVNFPGDEYFVSLSDGYYYGSKYAVQQLHFVIDLETYGFEQFDLYLNRPDIVLSTIGGASPSEINAYRSAWRKRVKKQGLNPDSLRLENALDVPRVEVKRELFVGGITNKRTYPVSIRGRDQNHRLTKLFIEIDGVPVNSSTGLPIENKVGEEFYAGFDLKLTQGVNTISISVMNEVGVYSLRQEFEIEYKPKDPILSDLHVIAIGVSNFQQSEFNLTYANKDANDISQTFSNISGDFENVVVHTLTNEQATRENVLALRNKLEQTEVDDEVIVFVASHGLLDEELDYYLAMHDTDFANPKDGGLRYDELEALIDGIPARNKAMFIDACHSGEVDKEESELVAANDVASGTVKSRGFKRVKTKASNSGIGLKTSFELMKELFADLRRNNGAIVISSASGQEYAFESSEWQNGVFTYSLLEGLKSGNADLNKDGEIVVSEIRDYVAKRVQELTNGKQNPTSRTENLENDFRVW